jgi:uncharacterized membrane protein YjfL (UPF0719 family)
MEDFLTEIAGALAYGGIGILLLAAGFVVIDLLTPGNLGELVCVQRNRSAGIITAAGMIAVGTIVATAIASSDGSLGEGLAETAGYGGAGVAMLALAYFVIDLITPGRLGDFVQDEGEQPAAYMTAAALIAVGAIVAASIN